MIIIYTKKGVPRWGLGGALLHMTSKQKRLLFFANIGDEEG